MGRLDGKVALITGAGGGMGRVATRAFVREGARVVASDVRAAAAEETVAGVRTITLSSPLGGALLGKKVGDTAEVAAPGGKFSVEVKALRPR